MNTSFRNLHCFSLLMLLGLLGEDCAPAPGRTHTPDPITDEPGGASGAGVGGSGGQLRAGAGGSMVPGGQAGSLIVGGHSGGGETTATDAAVRNDVRDAGVQETASDRAAIAGMDAALPPAGQVATIMAVGAGGIRLVSTDGGLTWQKRAETRANGGDDEDLLRAVAYGNGVWVAAGVFRMYTSTDTRTWAERAMPGCVEAIAFGQGKFIAICGGSTWVSSNGTAWTRGATAGGLGGHTYISFAENKFAAWSSEDARAFVSNDGQTWSALSGFSSAVPCNGVLATGANCHDAVAANGVWLRGRGTSVERSPTGTNFSSVYRDDHGNGIFTDGAYQAIAWAFSPGN